MGLWAGNQDEADSYSNLNGVSCDIIFFIAEELMIYFFQVPSSMDIYSIGADQFPPSYESVVEFDHVTAPPPPYDCVMHECIVILDPVVPNSAASGVTKETKKYPVTVQIVVDEQLSSNYI